MERQIKYFNSDFNSNRAIIKNIKIKWNEMKWSKLSNELIHESK